MKYFPADVLDGRTGEVVDQGIQHTVKVGQTNGDEKWYGQTFQSRAEFIFGMGTGYLIGLEPNHHLHDVAREEAKDEEHHDQYDEAQSFLNPPTLT